MMISQLATVAIRARVRVSPATVPPKFVIRSKSRFGSFAQRRRQRRRAAAWATSGSRSVRSSSLVERRGRRAVAGGPARRPRTASSGLAIPAPVEDLGDTRPRSPAGRLRRVLNVERVLARRPANRSVGVGRGLASAAASRRSARLRRRVISTRVEAGAERSRILSLTSGRSVTFVLGGADVEPGEPPVLVADLQALDRHVGQDARPCRGRTSAAATR